jgi:hypothetical protein
MRSGQIPFVVALITLAGCNQSQQNPPDMATKQTYSLCPKSDESRPRLREALRDFAAQNQARFIDRSAEAQNELSTMQSSKGALESTGGDLIILSVEKQNDFRVSLSNLGLREKVALSVRYWGKQQEGRVTALLADLERSWVIQRVEGGVADAPPCTPDE